MGRRLGSKNKRKSLVSKPNVKQSLLATPSTDYTRYMPTWYSINPTPEKIILPYERREQIRLGRDLFAKMPIVSAAIVNKNQVCVGDAWQPNFAGDIRKGKEDIDKQWVIAAENWLINDYYPNVNWQGQNYSFQDTLFLTGKDCDVCGGSLMLYRNTKSGLPRIQLIPTDLIGSRDGETIVSAKGSYNGYKIYDGVVFNNDNMPIALCILGPTKDDDQYISLFNCHYCFEAMWDGAVHGVSKIANAVTTLMDIRDINDLLKITVKNFSRKGIIHKNSKGVAPKGKRIFGVETAKPATSVAVPGQSQSKVFFESVNAGATEFISSLDGSDIQPFNFDRPSPNVEQFLFRISSEAVASIGWFIELITPSRLNGTSVRTIQDQARKLVVYRQRLLERRAKAITQYGLATAMQLGLVPMTDNKTFMHWTFSKPALITCDTGYDNAAQIESLKLGISTKEEICAKRGTDWLVVSEQGDKETRDLFDRAKKLANDYKNVTPEEREAREWLSKRDISIITTTQPPEPIIPDNNQDGTATLSNN